MSIRMMIRKCKHCRHKYTYNPSIGDMGEFCPRCHKAQSDIPISLDKNDKTYRHNQREKYVWEI